jgi:hypothetical protein
VSNSPGSHWFAIRIRSGPNTHTLTLCLCIRVGLSSSHIPGRRRSCLRRGEGPLGDILGRLVEFFLVTLNHVTRCLFLLAEQQTF